MSSLLIKSTDGPPAVSMNNSAEIVSTSASGGSASSAFRRVPPSANSLKMSSVAQEKDENSSSASESPPTLKRPPFDDDDDDEDDDEFNDRESSFENAGDNAFAWPSHNSHDEQRQLLGTEEESSDRGSSDEEEELMMENYDCPISSAIHGPGKKSVWSITREQINYYTTQFFGMQADPDGVIPGALAKEFFEKSRLPITELRKIWQLSDVSQDGCLSLEEFLTAMHLVVLRRNNIDLPEELPPVLRPPYLKQRLAKSSRRLLRPGGANHNKDLYNGNNTLASGVDDEGLEANERLLDDSGSVQNEDDVVDNAGEDVSKPRSKAIADVLSKSEIESETGSIISSPGRPQPVNFDFHRQEALRNDPTIRQPVAVRLSPDSPVLQSSDMDEDEFDVENRRRKASRAGEVGYEKLWNSTGKDDDCDTANNGGPVSLPPARLKKRDAASPPPPPPRGPGFESAARHHARSSSLDLNNAYAQRPVPVPPPRADGPQCTNSRDGKALHRNIQEYREKNSVVARTINELHQEVSDALEERIALEFQLEQLKSFGDDE